MWIQYKLSQTNSADYDERGEQQYVCLASIMNPESRCHDIFGDNGQLVDNAIFLSDNLMLVNF